MSFRSRIISAFLLFVFALSITFGWLLDSMMTVIEDKVAQEFMQEHLQYLESTLQSQVPSDHLISTPKITAYLSDHTNTPHALLNLPDGFHETEAQHILAKTLTAGPYQGNQLILTFDESQSFLDQNESNIFMTIGALILLVVLLAGIVCLYLAKSIASPIEFLAHHVKTQQGGLNGHPVLSRNDELGHLARAFSSTLDKINAFLLREKNFTRYASHELRTPLTVIKNNIELLQLLKKQDLSDNTQVKPIQINRKQVSPQQFTVFNNAVARLDQAAWLMEEQVNTFLLMARGTYTVNTEKLRLLPILQKVESYFPDLIVTQHLDEGATLFADPIIVIGILTNAFKNAMEHGANHSGKVTATVTADEFGLSISNRSMPPEEYETGERFGLEIIEHLCSIQCWALSIDYPNAESNPNFSITIRYSSGAD